MAQAAQMTALPPRSAVPKEHTWNAESVFATPADWDAEIEALSAAIPGVAEYQDRLAEGPTVLADAYDAVMEIYRRAMTLYIYAAISQAVDTTDQAAVAMLGRSLSVFGRAQAAVSFVEPETLAIGKETLDSWMEREDRLKIYAHEFDNLFRKQAHVRSAEVEEVLGLSLEPMRAIDEVAEMLVNADMTFDPAVDSDGDEVEVAQGTNDGLKRSPDRDLRRTAYESYNRTYLRFQNTLANNLALAVKRDVFLARARRYESSLEASLFDINIPTDVFHNLVDAYKENIPTWHRYWEVKRKALGLDAIYPYDVWAPLTDSPPEISYAQAVDWISEGVAPLGDEYVDALRRGCLEERWIDIYPNAGKREGAFSFGTYGTYPFINMSYNGTVGSMSTLAHELGHSMHSYFSWKTQPYVYSSYSLFVAEVASNFNQALVRAHLLETTDDRDLQIALIAEAMDNFHRYFFIMPTLARFELEIHERAERGEALTAEVMNDLCADLFAEGYGDAMSYDREQVGITWAQFSHLYASFYVYQYATGISGAHALANRVLKEGQSAARDYLGFLSAGSSKYPLDALKDAGVDLTTPDPVVETFGVLSSYVDRLEELTS